MTTFTSTRLGVLGRLIAFPAIVAAFAVRAAASEFRTEFGALRSDFMPAVRYIATGNPNKNVVAATVAKASSVRKSIGQSVSDFYEAHVMYRLYGLLTLLLFPILATVIAFYELEETGFFADAWASIKGAGRTLVSGRDYIA